MCWHLRIYITVFFNKWFVSFAVVKSIRNKKWKNDHDWKTEFPAHDKKKDDISNNGNEVSEHESKIVADSGFSLVDITAESAYELTWLVLLKKVDIVLDKLSVDVHFHVDREVFLQVLSCYISTVSGYTESDSYVQKGKNLSVQLLETDWVILLPHFCNAVQNVSHQVGNQTCQKRWH